MRLFLPRSPHRSPVFRLVRVAVLALGACALTVVQGQAAQPGRRIVAVGDVHGDYETFVRVLQQVGLLGEDLAWSGGETTLVQTGDFTDKGDDVRAVMDLLMRLQGEAAASGGEVVVLLGNHEILNFVGELRQGEVTPEILATFAEPDQRHLQEEAFKEYAQVYLAETRPWRRATRPQKHQVQKNWSKDQPLGRIEYLRAMGPEGVYGKWIRSLPRMKVIDGILFMHAGVAPELVGWGLEAIDERIGAELAAYDRYRAYLRARGRITSFADIHEMIRAAAIETEGLDWFQAPAERVTKPPALPPADLDSVDDPRQRFEPLLRVTGWFLLAARGPLWFRGLAQWPDAELEGRLPGLLEALGIGRFVVGHTPQLEGIRARAEGAVYLIDTGMLKSVHQGRGSALVLTNTGATAVYADGTSEALAMSDVALSR